MKLFKLLHDNTLYPSKAYVKDAGYDIYLPCDITLSPGETIKLPLEVSINWDIIDTQFITALILPRSSSLLYGKINMMAGVIDYGYTGSLHFVGTNISNETIILKKETRVLQCVFLNILNKIDDTNVINKDDRKNSSFGSSGGALKS